MTTRKKIDYIFCYITNMSTEARKYLALLLTTTELFETARAVEVFLCKFMSISTTRVCSVSGLPVTRSTECVSCKRFYHKCNECIYGTTIYDTCRMCEKNIYVCALCDGSSHIAGGCEYFCDICYQLHCPEHIEKLSCTNIQCDEIDIRVCPSCPKPASCASCLAPMAKPPAKID
jgi:hypothetical protein